VLWGPALLGILALSSPRPRQVARLLSIGLAAGLAALAGIYVFRSGLLFGAGDGQAAISIGEIRSLAYRMLFEEGFFPNRRVFLDSLWSSGATWLMIAFGAVLAVADVTEREKRRAALRLLLAASPIAFVLVYANAWPYAYVVLMPTACLLGGRAVAFLVDSREPVRRLIAAVALMAAAIPLASLAWTYRLDGQRDQQQVLSVVHRIFPQPVAYIDKSGMVSSFPRQPQPLTGQRIKAYREAGHPALKRFVEQTQPPLLIVNSLVLDLWNGGAEKVPDRFRLLVEDEDMIRESFAQFWGPIYLAGREWHGLDVGERIEFDIVIEGPYTLLADADVVVDGRAYRPGDSVVLSAGRHRLETLAPAERVRLLWGDGLKLPPEEPSAKPLFSWYGGG
jgi:hypothetical protein